VIAFELQKPEGIYLPSFTFHCKQGEASETLAKHIESQLREICQQNADVYGVIAKYGDRNSSRGISQLVGHFMHMSTDHPYVFGLVIGKLKHGTQSSEQGSVNDVARLSELAMSMHFWSRSRKSCPSAICTLHTRSMCKLVAAAYPSRIGSVD